MSNLFKFRMPYREDSLFGLVFLCAVLIPLAFDVYNFESFEIIKFGLLLLLVGGMGLIFFKRLSSQGAELRVNRIFLGALGIFLFWALLASLSAWDKNYAFFGFYPRLTNGFLFYFLWAALFLFLSALSFAQLSLLLRVLFFCSGLVALWGLLQSVGFGYYNGPTTEFFSRSAPSFLGNPNFSSMFVAALLPLGFALFSLAKTFAARAYYGLSLFVQVWGVVIFASRGALLALGAGLMLSFIFSLFAYKSLPKKFSLVFLAGLCLTFLLAGGFLNFTRPGTVTASLSLNETNINQRFNIWNLAWQSLKAKPVIGYGLGNFELVFEKFRPLSLVKNGFFDDPHNLFLYLAVSGGVLFCLLFLFLVAYPAYLALKPLAKSSPPEAVLTLGLLGSIVAWLTAAFFTPVVIACYVLLAFLVSGLFTRAQTFRLPYLKLGRALAAGICGLLVVWGLCFLTAEHLFFGSIRTYNAGNFLKAHKLVQAAIYLNPSNSIYYEYQAASAIRAHLPASVIDRELGLFSLFHQQRGYSHTLLANLNYLRLYEERDLAYKPLILQNLQQAISRDPEAANNYFLLAQYQFVFADLKAAEQAEKKGLGLDAKNFEALMFLAKIYQYQNNRAELVSSLQRAADVDPANPALDNLIKLARTTSDLSSLPFQISLNVGRLD